MDEVKKALQAVDVNTLTPMDALNELNKLKQKIKP